MMAIKSVDRNIINNSVGNACSTGRFSLYSVLAHSAAKIAAIMSGPDMLIPIFDFHDVMMHVMSVEISCTAMPMDKEGLKSGFDVWIMIAPTTQNTYFKSVIMMASMIHVNV